MFGKNGARVRESQYLVSTDLDDAIVMHQRKTAEIREKVREKRAVSREDVTPIEVPSITFIQAAKKILAKHSCGCEECEVLTQLVGR